jgi:hypothetical protein
MDDETRERLHHILSYLLESEANDYWHRHDPADREGHVYAYVLPLIQQFGFDDLAAWDAEIRDVGSGNVGPGRRYSHRWELFANDISLESVAKLDYVKWKDLAPHLLTLGSTADPVGAGHFLLVDHDAVGVPLEVLKARVGGSGPQWCWKVHLLDDAKPDKPAPFNIVPVQGN